MKRQYNNKKSRSMSEEEYDDDDKSATTGRWTKEEHDQFECGLKKFKDRQWKHIASMIPTRTVVQVRTHAQKHFQKLARMAGRNSDMKNQSKMMNTSISQQRKVSDHGHFKKKGLRVKRKTGMSMYMEHYTFSSPIEQPEEEEADMEVEPFPVMSALQPLGKHVLATPGFQNNTFIEDVDFLNLPPMVKHNITDMNDEETFEWFSSQQGSASSSLDETSTSSSTSCSSDTSSFSNSNAHHYAMPTNNYYSYSSYPAAEVNPSSSLSYYLTDVLPVTLDDPQTFVTQFFKTSIPSETHNHNYH